MEARRWLEGVTHPADRPLINVSQAAPVDPPVKELRQAMADAALNDDGAHLYGPVLGNVALRQALATKTTSHYDSAVTADNVAITSGCNQAFAAAISSLCAEGDEVILPTPWYFNHKMWLDMSGVTSVPLPAGPDLLPSAGEAAKLITARTRAIALVSPNNPAGVEYPADLLLDFYELAKAHDIALIVDETYLSQPRRRTTRAILSTKCIRHLHPPIFILKSIPPYGPPCWRIDHIQSAVGRN